MTLLIPPERYEIESSRLNWPLDQPSGVPGLPDGIAIMPTARSHAAVLRMPCASGKTYTVRRDLVNVAKTALVLVVTCNRLFTKATCKDWAAVYGEENVFCYLDGLGKSEAARDAKRRLKEMCDRRAGVLFVSIESFLALNAIIDPATVGAMARGDVRTRIEDAQRYVPVCPTLSASTHSRCRRRTSHLHRCRL